MTEIYFDLSDRAEKEAINLKRRIVAPFVNSSSSALSAYDEWYRVNGKLHYFKYRFVFEELFMNEIAKSLGLKCVDFKLAKCKNIDHIGIVSKNFRSFFKEYYYYGDYFWSLGIQELNDMMDLADFIKSDEKYRNLTSLFLLAALDVFSGQHDRWDYNVIIETSNGIPALSPLTDNSRIFVDFSSRTYTSSFGKFMLYADGDEVTKDHEETFDTLAYISELFDGLVMCLDIDIESYIDYTCEKYGLIIDEKDKQYIIRYFDKSKGHIDNTLSMVKR